MKKTFLFFVVLAIFVFSYCSKKSDPAISDLSGTSWTTSNVGTTVDPEYYMLKFTSKTIVESWYKAPTYQVINFEKELSGTYSISKMQITINFGDGPTMGSIQGNSMNFKVDSLTMVFTKQ